LFKGIVVYDNNATRRDGKPVAVGFLIETNDGTGLDTDTFVDDDLPKPRSRLDLQFFQQRAKKWGRTMDGRLPFSVQPRWGG